MTPVDLVSQLPLRSRCIKAGDKWFLNAAGLQPARARNRSGGYNKKVQRARYRQRRMAKAYGA
jgi:hypothetical protein